MGHVQPDSRSDLERFPLFLEIFLQTFRQKHQGGTRVKEGFRGGDVWEVFWVGVGSYAEFDLVIERMGNSVAGECDAGV